MLAVGEPRNYSGEAESRTDIIIPAAQMQVANAVIATGKPVVVLLKNGRAIALDDTLASAEAILVTWFLGKKAGDAIADLLFGDVSPSGRLPVSFPIRSGQQPYFYNHMSSGRPCTPGSRSFKNCWREISNDALYPFGFGLTYSQFEYVPQYSAVNYLVYNQTDTLLVTEATSIAWLVFLYSPSHAPRALPRWLNLPGLRPRQV